MARQKHITPGTRFARLVVLAPAGQTKKSQCLSFCACDCGNFRIAANSRLKNGYTQSCGCMRRDRFKLITVTHGKSADTEYRIWDGIRARCTRPSHQAWANYGGRGITVCEAWLKSFAAFYADMGDRPSPKHTIDRIDNECGYSPDNCRWATREEQASNRRRTARGSLCGEVDTLVNWAARLGVSLNMLHKRMNRYGVLDDQPLAVVKLVEMLSPIDP